ncbi:hypothetical protein C7212DRAFT_350812 [Tuber magnatum]|uniref:Transcription factor domain-containing protein n=1 Tax=Tuber magnatum TaxID=42249 RepID=A0A317STY3_9PEZI|nr:hypothetical protein C7212DRAFT_350812 [Tuber magnatum]
MSVSSSVASSPTPSDAGPGAASPSSHSLRNCNQGQNHASKNGNSFTDSIMAASVREGMKLASPSPPSLTNSRYTFYSLRELPPLEVTSRLVSAFIRGTSSMFYILAEYEAMELISDIYTPNSEPTTAKLCELLAIVAVGAQYEDVGRDTSMALFRSAKWYLDIEYGKDVHVLRKMRVSMLVGLLLIFEKSFFAVDYLDQAVCLAKSTGINRTARCKPYSEREWASWRRVWRSLIFLDGWMASSIGVMPKIAPGEDPIYAEGYRTCTNDFDAYLHSELTKLGILMNMITRNIYAPAATDFASVAEHSKKLRAWQSSLPEPFRLTRSVSGNDSKQRSAVLFTHCSYLNCIVLLSRKVLVGVCATHDVPPVDDTRRGLADEYAQMCVSAGRQLATVIGLIYSEGRLVRRCWLAIQSSYTAGLIVSLCLATQRYRETTNFALSGQDNELLSNCVEALKFCAPYDNVAQRYLDILNSILRSIESATSPSSSSSSSSGGRPTQKRLRISPDQEFGRFQYPRFTDTDPVTQFIINLLRNPFGGEMHVLDGENPPLEVLPENWRFMCPEPPHNIGGFRTRFSASEEGAFLPSRPGSASSSTGSDSLGGSRRRKIPFRTKEEFEAFFRRVA